MKQIDIEYKDITLIDMCYLLSNYDGWLDADRQRLVIDL